MVKNALAVDCRTISGRGKPANRKAKPFAMPLLFTVIYNVQKGFCPQQPPLLSTVRGSQRTRLPEMQGFIYSEGRVARQGEKPLAGM